MNKSDIAVWGRTPPPVGGMSVHLERLIPFILKQGLTFQMYSVGRETSPDPRVIEVSNRRISWILSNLLFSSEKVHYVFSDNTLARFAASLLSFFGRSKVVLRIGGETLETAITSGVLQRILVKFSMRHATVVVGVNQQICERAESLGATRVLHIPGFIPPIDTDEALPESVNRWLKGRDFILMSGEIGQSVTDDLYGAFRLLELVEADRTLVVVIYSYLITRTGEDEARFVQELESRGLQDQILVYRSSGTIQPALKECKMLFRPTTTDGDSNIIREALSLGTPVLASDCVERPVGAHTLALAESNAAVLQKIHQVGTQGRNQPNLGMAGNAEAIVQLLLELNEK